jgi:hypothetical protein
MLEILAIVQHWKNLQGMHFRDCTLSPKVLDAIQDLPGIIRFSLVNSDNSGSELAPHSFLRRVESMDLEGLKDVDSGIMALRGSKNLRALALDRTRPSLAGIKALGQCPNLIRLSMAEATITDDQLVALSELPQLEELWLKRVHLDPDRLVQLQGLKHLHRIYITSYGWSHEKLAALIRALPQCQID